MQKPNVSIQPSSHSKNKNATKIHQVAQNIETILSHDLNKNNPRYIPHAVLV